MKPVVYQRVGAAAAVPLGADITATSVENFKTIIKLIKSVCF